jgi:hypothetical protein
VSDEREGVESAGFDDLKMDAQEHTFGLKSQTPDVENLRDRTDEEVDVLSALSIVMRRDFPEVENLVQLTRWSTGEVLQCIHHA